MKKYAIITILFAMLVAVFYVALAYPLEDEPGKFATPIPTRTATLLPLWTATPERDTPPPPLPTIDWRPTSAPTEAPDCPDGWVEIDGKCFEKEEDDGDTCPGGIIIKNSEGDYACYYPEPTLTTPPQPEITPTTGNPYPPPEDPYPGITPIVVPTEIGNPTSTPGPTLFPYWQCRDQNINCTELACQLIKNDGQDYHRVCCQRYDIMCREVPTDAPTDYP